MAFEKDEIGKMKPKKDEPLEPFLPEEGIQAPWTQNPPLISNIHLPKPPLHHKKLQNFLLELKPLIQEINKMKMDEKNQVGVLLQEIKKHLDPKKFSKELIDLFEKACDQFNHFLVSGLPSDQEATLHTLSLLEDLLAA